MNDLAWNLTIALMGLVVIIFIWVILNSSGQTIYEESAKKAYSVRGGLFWIAIIAGAIITYATLTPWPHPGVPDATAPRIVDVIGQQWSWQLSEDKVKVGETVEFHVTSKDVNHGFGLYDPSGHLVAQVQAMPGYTNRLRYTFPVPGEYKVMCMEYCGVVHHNMITSIKVSPRATS